MSVYSFGFMAYSCNGKAVRHDNLFLVFHMRTDRQRFVIRQQVPDQLMEETSCCSGLCSARCSTGNTRVADFFSVAVRLKFALADGVCNQVFTDLERQFADHDFLCRRRQFRNLHVGYRRTRNRFL